MTVGQLCLLAHNYQSENAHNILETEVLFFGWLSGPWEMLLSATDTYLQLPALLNAQLMAAAPWARALFYSESSRFCPPPFFSSVSIVTILFNLDLS
jgi:hypothetical protein